MALQNAVRTRDFERIRWAGIRLTGDAARLVTSADSFPPVARGITLG